MSSIGLPNSLTLTLAVFLAVLCVSCVAEDGTVSREPLVQSIADAQKRFDSLSSKESPEAIDATQSVIACKRELLSHLVERNKVEDADLIRREVLSQARDISRIAGLREKRQEYKDGQSEWDGFADSCKQALGINRPEYWHAIQEADALGRMAIAEPSTIEMYLDNRSKKESAAGQKDHEKA